MTLQQTLSAMLEKAGLYGGEDGDMRLSLDGPTQLHNVLELIKTEQKIYNIVFHEVIRQVGVLVHVHGISLVICTALTSCVRVCVRACVHVCV